MEFVSLYASNIANFAVNAFTCIQSHILHVVCKEPGPKQMICHHILCVTKPHWSHKEMCYSSFNGTLKPIQNGHWAGVIVKLTKMPINFPHLWWWHCWYRRLNWWYQKFNFWYFWYIWIIADISKSRINVSLTFHTLIFMEWILHCIYILLEFFSS